MACASGNAVRGLDETGENVIKLSEDVLELTK